MTGASGTPAPNNPATSGSTPHEQNGVSPPTIAAIGMTHAFAPDECARDERVAAGGLGAGREQHREREPWRKPAEFRGHVGERAEPECRVDGGNEGEEQNEREHHAVDAESTRTDGRQRCISASGRDCGRRE
jgi:hypothetical protein